MTTLSAHGPDEVTHGALDVDAAVDLGAELRAEIGRALERRGGTLHERVTGGFDDDRLATAYRELGLGELLGPGGASMIEAVAAVEAAGRGLAMPWLLPDGVLAATAVRRTGADVPAGVRRTAVALRHPAAGTVRDVGVDGQVLVTASCPATLLAAEADEVVVLRELPDQAAEVLLVPLGPVRAAGGLHAEPAMDPLRPARALTLDETPGRRLGVLSPQTSRLVEAEWLLAVAADALGAMSDCVDRAVAYAGLRKAFGRSIGSNQALRHRIVEMFVSTQTARSSVEHTAVEVALESSTALAEALTCAAHTLSVFPAVARQGLLVLGGIGFTWEGDIHFHVRRSFTAPALVGDVSALRSRLLDLG